ncbi:type III secretion system translocon subunit SctB [Photobacterium chitinilyticum]|uniref:Uncharacterized protein n=1 Tax=Photobacterium chitinilyticum TaxID=2485123 RepID=A0A444JN21_9GAMM|nr:type III secretion system translocon subunit SctB [Photobacterium chitinilyticum]RWX54500.1 hypothetical protein EDI28_15450 [Photobacterium chitinilyticum]
MITPVNTQSPSLNKQDLMLDETASLTGSNAAKKANTPPVLLQHTSAAAANRPAGFQMLESPLPRTGADYSMAFKDISKLDHEDTMVQISDILTMMHQLATTQRQQARESRMTEREAAVGSILGQADKMREQAELERLSGWISAGISIASGAMQVSGGVKALKMNISDAKLQTVNSIQQAKTQILTGVGQLLTTQIDYHAKQKQADGKVLEADQKVHETAMEDEGQQMQFYLDVIRDARQKLEEVMRSQQESMKSIVRA